MKHAFSCPFCDGYVEMDDDGIAHEWPTCTEFGNSSTEFVKNIERHCAAGGNLWRIPLRTIFRFGPPRTGESQ